MKAIINARIFDFESFKENGYILFDSEIQEVGPMSEFLGADEVFDCKGSIVMPGLVVGHTHIYSTFARGLSVPFKPHSFQELLEQLWWKLDAALDKEAIYSSALVSGVEFIKNGVTTIIDHHASGMDIKGTLKELKKGICDHMGIRGIFCFETSDRFHVDDCIEENIEFAKYKTQKHAGLFGMHASMSLSDHTLKKISEKVGHLPIHVHVAESKEDQQDSYKKYGKSVVERLETFNLLKKDSILSHCVHIDEKDTEYLKKNKVFVALNPTSNMNNGVGLPNYLLFKEKGIPCILGNDGLGTNITREWLNIVFCMRHRLSSPIAFSFEDLVNIMNNSYEYIGNMLGIKIGRIQKGYKADMIAVPYLSPTVINQTNGLSHIFFGLCDHFHPKDVWCDGEVRMRDYVVYADVENIYAHSRKVSKKVWERVGGRSYGFEYNDSRN